MQYTSSDFPRVITNKSVTVTFKDKTQTVKSDSPSYSKLMEALREQRWDDIPALLTPETAVEALSSGMFRVESHQVYLKDDNGKEFTVDSELNDNLLLHVEQGLDLKPMVLFAKNLHSNPSYNSRKQLFSWIQNTHLTITDDGCFLAYKKVRDDFTDCHTGTFDNSPGAVLEMPRENVDDNPNNHCSNGWHAGSIEFCRSFGGNRLLLVKINPRDVVSVPSDESCGKLRICKYEVIKEVSDQINDLVYKEEEMFW